jgi:hypothetical protein
LNNFEYTVFDSKLFKKNILNQLKSFGSLMLPKAHDKILYSPATSPAGEATRLLAEAGPWLGFGCFVGAQRLKDFRAEVWPWAMGHGGPWAMGHGLLDDPNSPVEALNLWNFSISTSFMVIWWSCLLMFIGAMVFIQTHFYPRID